MGNKNSILIVVTRANLGGAQISVLNLAKKLKKDNINVIVGLGEKGFLAKALDKESISTKQFKNLKRSFNPFKSLFFIFEIKKYLNRHSFDTIHFNSSNSLFGAIGAKLSAEKPKIIFTLRGLSFLDPNHKTNPVSKIVYRLLFKFLLKFVDVPVFVSQENFNYATTHSITKKGIVIHNGHDPDSLHFKRKEESIKILTDLTKTNLKNKFIIGSIGRLAYPKNYEFFIEAFSKIVEARSNAIGIIIGGGLEKNKYLKLIKKYKLEKNFFLVGEIKNASRLLPAYNLFVLPSIYEGLSNTLIEALLASIPILASQVGGSGEVVSFNPSQLYESGHEKQFINRTLAFMDNPDLIKTTIEENKKIEHRFYFENTYKYYKNIYFSEK